VRFTLFPPALGPQENWDTIIKDQKKNKKKTPLGKSEGKSNSSKERGDGLFDSENTCFSRPPGVGEWKKERRKKKKKKTRCEKRGRAGAEASLDYSGIKSTVKKGNVGTTSSQGEERVTRWRLRTQGRELLWSRGGMEGGKGR